MSDNRRNSIREYLQDNILITDGAMGTFFASVYDTQELPEFFNLREPEKVQQIHEKYIVSGAKLIRTNTYASNTISLGCSIEEVLENVRAACGIAKRAVAGREDVFIAGDIGPVIYDHNNMQEQVSREYSQIARAMLECGVDAIIFETFSDMSDIQEALCEIRDNSDVFTIVQFAVNQFGYSASGLSAKRLITEADSCACTDAVGLNCGVGPGHMCSIFDKMKLHTKKYITALPNAGYPQTVSNRMIFAADNSVYFSQKAEDIVSLGINIIGGCCGTTPEYTKKLCERLSGKKPVSKSEEVNSEKNEVKVRDNAFYRKKTNNEKLIAVELAPPVDSDDQKLMEAAHILQKSGVDVLTFPDSPSGRTRADSVLMAEKVAKETGIEVMPHLCCRDKNAIAMRSQLLGAHINNINNFLVITGDPVPSMVRQSVKAVFNFDSVGLMNIIRDMNESQFSESPIVYGGAINQTRRNLDVEISRVKKKMEAGATFFFTQPVFDDNGVARLKQVKNETGARILCGIMPFVSLKNAVFMKNEMTGIEVSDEIISRYRKCVTKEDGEAVGVQIAKEVIAKTTDFVDGYYFSFPFNRVYLLDRIL